MKRHLLNLFVISLGTTIGVVTVLLITAKTPDADEFTRGVPAGITGAIIGWVLRGILPTTIATSESSNDETNLDAN